MLIKGKGISVEADVNGGVLTYRVVEQTKEASNALTLLGIVRDKDTGYSLRTNDFPSYNKNKKRFFVRGKEKSGDGKSVVVDFKSTTEAARAFQALQRMVSKVSVPQASADGRGVIYAHGGTSGIRFALIKRSQAMILDLTGKRHYPDERFWIPNTPPVVTVNRHYNEHIGQVVDVLNKAHEAATPADEDIINAHKATPARSRLALAAVRRLFDEAERDDYLVELWRTVTGIRGPDFVDDEEKKQEPDESDVPRHP
jgi:hypothetical protein